MQIILILNRTRCRLNLRLNRTVVMLLACSATLASASLFFMGVRYADGRSVAVLNAIRAQTAATWQEDLDSQRREVDEIKVRAQSSLDALAGKLSLLQGRVMRLDALGSRLAEMARIEDMDFTDSGQPGMGGSTQPGELESIAVEDVIAALGQLEYKLQDRDEKLTAMESLLINRSLQEMTHPDGGPTVRGWLSSAFGYRTDPITGKKEFHEGLDFSGKPGTPITAAAAGIVTWSGPSQGYGNMVEISHMGGYVTRYAHNHTNLVTVGDKIEKGEVVAVMGNSGRSTGTHVHFEVLKNGKQVNPKGYIATK